jgi:hypothetical protein
MKSGAPTSAFRSSTTSSTSRRMSAPNGSSHPGMDMENLLVESGLPLGALESGTPLKAISTLWGCPSLYELTYTNVLAMLKLARIPFLAGRQGRGAIRCSSPVGPAPAIPNRSLLFSMPFWWATARKPFSKWWPAYQQGKRERARSTRSGCCAAGPPSGGFMFPFIVP